MQRPDKIRNEEPQFAVLHLGARLHYAAAAALAEGGMLRALYTDACSHGLGRNLVRLWPKQLRPSGLRRWEARRIPPNVPKDAVYASALPSLQLQILNSVFPRRSKSARFVHRLGIGGHWLAARAIAHNFAGANALYAHPCVGTNAVVEAKRRGLFVVVEAISHPFNKVIEQKELEHFGHPPSSPEGEIADNIAFFRAEAEQADLVLAASRYVAAGLAELGIPSGKIEVVPYGLAAGFFSESPTPQPGRVLFVGNVGYLKGVPHLAEAARLLSASGVKADVRGVGPVDRKVINRFEFAGPTYVGQVPRDEVKKEFSSADVFVFPTLSDGFGMVVMEAMAAGLPVICTPNCADLVEDGHNGFVVPARDSKSLCDRITQIISDRELRQRLSQAARKTASSNGLDAYSTRLVRVLARRFQEFRFRRSREDQV